MVPDVAIGEEFAEFGDHLEFEFHEMICATWWRPCFLAKAISILKHSPRVKITHSNIGHRLGVHGGVVGDLVPVQGNGDQRAGEENRLS